MSVIFFLISTQASAEVNCCKYSAYADFPVGYTLGGFFPKTLGCSSASNCGFTLDESLPDPENPPVAGGYAGNFKCVKVEMVKACASDAQNCPSGQFMTAGGGGCSMCPTAESGDTAEDIAAARNNIRKMAQDTSTFDSQCPAGSVPSSQNDCDHSSLESELAKCQSGQSYAEGACDTEKDSGMNSAIKQADAAAQGLNQASAAGVNNACGVMGTVGMAANSAIAAFQVNCGLKRKSCMDDCSVIKKKAEVCNNSSIVSSSNSAIGICQNLANKLQSAGQALSAIRQTASGATQCADASSGGAFCKAFPSNVACQGQLAQNCSSTAYAASNPACACVSNPNSQQCAQSKAGSSDAIGNGLAGLSDSGNLKNDGSSLNLDDPLADSNYKPKTTEMGEDPGSAGGPGGARGGPGGNQIGGPGGAGKAVAEDRKGGIFGFMGSTGAGGGGFLGGAAKAVGKMFGYEQKEAGPDLRKFLPKANQGINAMRGLAGSTGPDGITGPNGDIWMKVKNRYQAQIGTFIP